MTNFLNFGKKCVIKVVELLAAIFTSVVVVVVVVYS